ncbi:MAG: tRNA (adenosine(37)-N6)-threonylcarbamoyltransferase complex ATPase subunit type 1 TsaE [Chlamydiota bacterium]|jgi:tRNA threonylcarbamoyladenosine biosynthesis protein TsaE
MAQVTSFILNAHREAQTKAFAKKLASEISIPNIILLEGDLGAGKTTFTKGFLSFFGVSEAEVQSPTFAYVNQYFCNSLTISHFDLYRLNSDEEFLALGFEEYLFSSDICLIEWPQIITPILTQSPHLKITLSFKDEESRKLEVSHVEV